MAVKVRTLVLIVLMVLLGAWGFNQFLAPRVLQGRSLRVGHVQGNVQAINVFNLSVDLARGTRLYPGTRLRTRKGRLVVSLGKNDRFIVPPNSTVTLESVRTWSARETVNRDINENDPDEDAFTIREKETVRHRTIRMALTRGEIYTALEPAPTTSFDLSIRSPAAVASVNGTKFVVEHRKDGPSKILVQDGQVEVQSTATGQTRQVSQGQLARAGSTSGTIKRRQLNEDEMKYLKRLASASNVEATRQTLKPSGDHPDKLPLNVHRTLRRALEQYKVQHQRYPEDLRDAVKKPIDPWGNRYRYTVIAEGRDYELISSGPDRQPDTDDDIYIH